MNSIYSFKSILAALLLVLSHSFSAHAAYVGAVEVKSCSVQVPDLGDEQNKVLIRQLESKGYQPEINSSLNVSSSEATHDAAPGSLFVISFGDFSEDLSLNDIPEFDGMLFISGERNDGSMVTLSTLLLRIVGKQEGQVVSRSIKSTPFGTVSQLFGVAPIYYSAEKFPSCRE